MSGTAFLASFRRLEKNEINSRDSREPSGLNATARTPRQWRNAGK
jgi:hypothetical protein